MGRRRVDIGPGVIPEVVPGAEIISTRPTLLPPSGGTPGPPGPPGPPGATPNLRDGIQLMVTDGVTMNVAGNPITVFSLDALNAAFANWAYAMPGDSGDDNNVQWATPVPSNMADVPDLRIRLFLALP